MCNAHASARPRQFFRSLPCPFNLSSVYGKARGRSAKKRRALGREQEDGDGIIKLNDIMSDESIKKLELFEKANTNKSCSMPHFAAMRYLDFCESLYKNKEIDKVSEFWEHILRDCCGFTAENAHDFAMTLSLRIK